MTDTPVSERKRIGFFGRRNAGKSSLINAVAGQELSIISPQPGTTADPVSKTMEILPLGPVVLTDTAGIDDEGELGVLRVKKTYEVLNKTDICVLVCDINQKDFYFEDILIDKFKKLGKPYILVFSKDDYNTKKINIETDEKNYLFVSAEKNIGIEELTERIGQQKSGKEENAFLEGIAGKNKIILLVCPIDASAPKGRLILPQAMAIRDILDKNGIAVTVQPSEIPEVLKKVRPDIVITDSQVFKKVNDILPRDIPLTGFSVLMARYRSDFFSLLMGVKTIDTLRDNDKILIAEACTHHAEKNDIGRQQIPDKIRKRTGKNIIFDYSVGGEFPECLENYKLIIHCGGCMISKTAMCFRQAKAAEHNIPMTNYGIVLAYLAGILDRATEPLTDKL